MNLKKNDKLILIVGVVILVIAATAIAFYTSADVDDIDVFTESDKKTFDITWNEVKTDKSVINGKAEKSYSESEHISAPDGSILTKVEFNLTWEDDYTSGLLINKGEDTLTAKIGKPGAEPEKKTSIKQGTMKFSFNVNDMPSDDYIEAEDLEDAKEIVDEWFPNENEASFDVTVNVQTGEKLRLRPIKLLRYFKDKGNDFDLKITYTYYVFNIEEPEEDGNSDDDVPPTGLGGDYNGACGEFYKNLCYGRGMI
jgi:hypothetical protein